MATTKKTKKTSPVLKDFLGQPITTGCFVASGGLGNRSCEYGMILHRVESIDPIRLTRLTVHYPTHKASEAVAGYRTSPIKSFTKYVVVTPPTNVVTLFEAVCKGTATQAEMTLVSNWIHGISPVF